MNAGRAKYTATLLLDGRVLVAGLGPLASAELYEPGSGTWAVTGSMDEDRGHTATLLRDGRVLVAGGGSRGEVSPLPSFAELYDPDAGSWTTTGNMVTPRDGNTATVLLDGRVLVAGGSGNGYLPASPSCTTRAAGPDADLCLRRRRIGRTPRSRMRHARPAATRPVPRPRR